jgi:surface antigen
MRTQLIIVMTLALSLVLSACTTQPTQEQAGMVIGGALGGLLGNQVKGNGPGRTVAIIAGTLAGAAIGGAIGRSMDETDRLKTGTTLETVRTGVSSSWRNPDTGAQYKVTPTRTFETTSGPCREFIIDATVGSERDEVYGTACRQPDGTWQIRE